MHPFLLTSPLYPLPFYTQPLPPYTSPLLPFIPHISPLPPPFITSPPYTSPLLPSSPPLLTHHPSSLHPLTHHLSSLHITIPSHNPPSHSNPSTLHTTPPPFTPQTTPPLHITPLQSPPHSLTHHHHSSLLPSAQTSVSSALLWPASHADGPDASVHTSPEHCKRHTHEQYHLNTNKYMHEDRNAVHNRTYVLGKKCCT